ncbi:hypothetical protein BC835DRAFT_1276470 [Cytidiella melzeri]|nr:hypothetical protein BC835DRAFT_1276470 [Cytidiella melzeri]
MARSEIDDIFASKGQQNSSQPAASSSKLVQKPDHTTKKSSKRKRKLVSVQEVKAVDDNAEHNRRAKRRAPETVFDTSLAIPSSVVQKKRISTKKTKKDDGTEAEERFKDSRGTGPRRRTEEGFAIYKEDELGISAQGGDTALCPFDCQCCESAAFNLRCAHAHCRS